MSKLPLNLTTTLALFITISVFANDIHTYTLEKGQKLTSTFSADINENTSIHWIVFKNKKTKTFGARPLLGKNDGLTKLQDFEFETVPSLLSYHTQNDKTSFIFLNKYKDVEEGKKVTKIQLTILDYIHQTNTFEKEDKIDFEEGTIVIGLDHITKLITKEEGTITIISIQDAKNRTEQRFDIEDTDKLNDIYTDLCEYIDTRKYIKNGSISPSKVFFEQDKLFFTTTDIESKQTQIMILNTKESSDITFDTFNVQSDLKLKNFSTYIFNNKLFLFYTEKKDMFFECIDLKTGSVKFSTSFKEGLTNSFDLLKIKALHRKVKADKNYEGTITVNESKDGHLIVRFDAVYAPTYNYYNWHFHQFMWQQQQMMNQQMMMQQNMQRMMNNIPRFGPNPAYYDHLAFFNPLDPDVSLSLVFSADMELINKGSTIPKKKDEKEYVKAFERNMDHKEVSIAFLKDTYRTFWYSKKQKQFILTNHSY